MENDLLKKQLILNALRSAKQQIAELYTEQETGKIDTTFGNNNDLRNLYYEMNEMCVSLSNDSRFWYNK